MLYVDGLLLLILAGGMMVPLIVDAATGSDDWRAFAVSGAITVYVGGVLVLSSRGHGGSLDRRAGYLLTVSSWLAASAFASLPFMLSSLSASVTDAFFETISGLTTTGSTVFAGLDAFPPGVLLWRSMLQWIGGAGMVLTAMLLLPRLSVGGMQLFRMESSDISDKPVSRLYHMARLTVAAYAVLTVACATSYGLAGMGAFDAVNHALTTVSTGGFSTRDASIGAYGSLAVEVVGIVFMLAGAMPLMWWASLATQRGRTFAQERQVPVFLVVFAMAVCIMTAWNVTTNHMELAYALRVSAFNVASILTTTGYATVDFSAWGGFAVGLFFVLMLIGGCAGSTAGAVKVFRWQILLAGVMRHFRGLLSPHRVLITRYGDRPVGESMLIPSAISSFSTSSRCLLCPSASWRRGSTSYRRQARWCRRWPTQVRVSD